MKTNVGSITREVKAEDLLRELTQDRDEWLRRLRRGKSLLPLCNAKVVGKLDLKHQTIKKPVIIRDTEFEDKVDLRYAEFEQVVDFSGCIFHKEFNSGDEVESHTVFKKDLIFNMTDDYTVCRRTVFEGPAKFNGVRIEGAAYFNRALFLNQKLSIDLTTGSIEKGLECNTAIFKGKSLFGRLKCKDLGYFDGAVFLGEEAPMFAFASFSGPLSFQGATFEGPADFTFVNCEGIGFFRDTKFLCQDDTEDIWAIDFTASSFSGPLIFQGATLEGSASFDSLICAGTGFFSDGFHAKGAVYFSYASFGMNLDLQGSRFDGTLDVTSTNISRDLILTDACFEQDEQGKQEVLLYNASCDQLRLESTTFPYEGVLLDLREYEFKGFAGPDENPEEHALKFARAQDPYKFSRDPYLQLEKYYSGNGDEVQAKIVYYEGRRDLRENVRKYGSERSTRPTRWADRFNKWRRVKLTSWGDWCLKWLTGYGVRTERLLIWLLPVFIIGFLVFWSSNALKAAESSRSTASTTSGKNTVTNGKQEPLTLLAKKKAAEPKRPQLIDRIAYSLDLFLPVDLGITSQWEPQGRWREMYVLLQSLVGWLLIPLLIASLSGIIRRQ